MFECQVKVSSLKVFMDFMTFTPCAIAVLQILKLFANRMLTLLVYAEHCILHKYSKALHTLPGESS